MSEPSPDSPASPPDPGSAHGPDRVAALEARLARLENDTRALSDYVRQLHAYLAATAPGARGAASAAAPAPTTAPKPAEQAAPVVAAPAATNTAGELLAARTAARVEEQQPAAAAAVPPAAEPPRVEQPKPTPVASAPVKPPVDPVAEEARRAEAARRAAAAARVTIPTKPAPPPRPAMSLEDTLANALPIGGGILLLIGAAIGAVLVYPHIPTWGVVALGYLAAAILGGAGFGVSFKALWPGRIVMMIGLALAYFLSFAAGFISYVQVLPLPVSVGLMFAFATGIAACSQAWKSEGVAAFGLMLGVLAALASAGTSQLAALVALVILSVAAGALLVTREWVSLNAAALVFIALATILMWKIAPVPHAHGAVAAHLGALLCYYVVFTAAFARWGGLAMTRERLAVEAPDLHATPRVHLEGATLAYSSIFAQVNSLVFGALALMLVASTKVFWDVVWAPLAAMAALEALRLLVPVLRRGTLLGFHTLTSLSLATMAASAYFSGLAESAVMAFMTMVIAMVASRSRLLGWLRPLTFITTLVAFHSYNYAGAASAVDLLKRLLPPAFLLASVLPWESIAVFKPRRYTWGVLELAEILSGNARSVVASLMVSAAMIDWFGPSEPSLGGMMVLAKGVALLVGLLVLSSWNWFAAVALALCFGTLLLGMEVKDQPWFFLSAGCWTLVAVVLWHEVARQSTSVLARVCSMLAGASLAFFLVLLNVVMVAQVTGWNGLWLSVLGLATAGAGWLASQVGPWPRLIEAAPYDSDQWSITGQQGLADAPYAYTRPAWAVAVALAAIGLGQVVVLDSATQLFSALIVTAAWVAVWATSLRATRWPSFARWAFALAALFTLCPAILVFGDGNTLALPAVGLVALGAMVTGMALRQRSMLVPALLWLLALGPMALLSFYDAVPRTSYDGVLVLLIGLVIVVVASAARLGLGRCALDDNEQATVGALLVASGMLAVLGALGAGGLLPGYLVTASWGVLAALLMVAGFGARDSVLRYAAFAVFVLAMGRIFTHDMARMDTFTRFVAFFGLGFLMVAGGIVYWLLRPRSTAANKQAE